jgi:hypothetical protein
VSRDYKDIDLVSANVENIDLKDATTFIFEDFVKSNEHIIQKIYHQKQTSNKKQQ